MASLADLTGHFWQTIWDDPANKELKETRENPETLLPGDKVTIPDLREKAESRETDLIHTFKRKGVPVKVVFTVAEQGADGKVFSDKFYILKVGKRRYEGKTDQDGKLEHWVAPSAKSGELTVDINEDGYPPWLTWEIGVGMLGPADTRQGATDRLRNLGYLSEDGESSEATLESAVSRFQSDAGLEQTGNLDSETTTALEKEHGD